MINKELLKEIEAYCELNELEVPKTLNEALRSGFTILQYGMGPNSPKPKERVVEVIKEVIREVPVEVIREVEVIKEVPVDRIVEIIKEIEVIKEVPVDREVIKEVAVDREVIKEVPIEKSININVDGHKIGYMEYIDQLNVTISELEISKKKTSKELSDINNKFENLEIELSDYKTRLDECNKKQRTGLDLYGE